MVKEGVTTTSCRKGVDRSPSITRATLAGENLGFSQMGSEASRGSEINIDTTIPLLVY